MNVNVLVEPFCEYQRIGREPVRCSAFHLQRVKPFVSGTVAGTKGQQTRRNKIGFADQGRFRAAANPSGDLRQVKGILCFYCTAVCLAEDTGPEPALQFGFGNGRSPIAFPNSTESVAKGTNCVL